MLHVSLGLGPNTYNAYKELGALRDLGYSTDEAGVEVAEVLKELELADAYYSFEYLVGGRRSVYAQLNLPIQVENS